MNQHFSSSSLTIIRQYVRTNIYSRQIISSFVCATVTEDFILYPIRWQVESSIFYHEFISYYSYFYLAFRWTIEHKKTLFQNLIGVFSDQGLIFFIESIFTHVRTVFLLDYVWTLNSEKLICSSVGHILEKPRQAQYITQATFVPQRRSEGKVWRAISNEIHERKTWLDAILWALDESCNIYVRSNTKEQTQWHLLNQVQFGMKTISENYSISLFHWRVESSIIAHRL